MHYFCINQYKMDFEKKILRRELFWDINVNDIDFERHKQFIIERITLRGNFEEFLSMIRYYEKNVVGTALQSARWLDKKTLSFCAAFFKIPKENFRCYKLGQLNPEHLSY